jgi:hypothetical protein
MNIYIYPKLSHTKNYVVLFIPCVFVQNISTHTANNLADPGQPMPDSVSGSESAGEPEAPGWAQKSPQT